MTLLILGLAIFFIVHASTMARSARAGLVQRFGEGPYKGAFSALSLVGIVLVVWGFVQYRGAGLVPYYAPPAFGRHIGPLLLLFAFILIAAANMKPGYIKSSVQHPFLLAIALWAIAHLLMNGDQGGLLLFGAFLVYVLIDLAAVFARGPVAMPAPDWRYDARAVVGGVVVLLLVVFVVHPYIFQIPINLG